MTNKLELSKLSLEQMSAAEMRDVTGGMTWQEFVALIKKILHIPPTKTTNPI